MVLAPTDFFTAVLPLSLLQDPFDGKMYGYMRYFITGATGFIGEKLTRRLLASGHDVTALTRSPEKARHLSAAGADLIRGTLADRDTIRRGMEGADRVAHLAAWYRVGTADARRAYETNVEGTRNVLETMWELGVSAGVYTSSLAVFSDTGGEVRDESYRYKGAHLSLYDETKWRAHYEVALPMMAQGLPLRIVMPGAVYGPGDTSQLAESFRHWFAGRLPAVVAETAYCWAHVEDVATAHLLALDAGRPGETYIVGGDCHTLEEAFETASRVTGRKAPPFVIPPRPLRAISRALDVVGKGGATAAAGAEMLRAIAGVTYLGSNEKARRELGYAPRSLRLGFADTFPQVGPCDRPPPTA